MAIPLRMTSVQPDLIRGMCGALDPDPAMISVTTRDSHLAPYRDGQFNEQVATVPRAATGSTEPAALLLSLLQLPLRLRRTARIGTSSTQISQPVLPPPPPPALSTGGGGGGGGGGGAFDSARTVLAPAAPSADCSSRETAFVAFARSNPTSLPPAVETRVPR